MFIAIILAILFFFLCLGLVRGGNRYAENGQRKE